MVLWWQIVVTVVCICLSGTFSGLTLGLMSLDIIDLRVLTESGTEKERWYANRILPVRKHGNWLLCTLLIGNTAVNSALAIVTADLFGGIAGFLSSTIAILYIGEIIPQAVCHRFGLVIGAYAIPLVKVFMFLTWPISFPTAKVLDCLLGGESVTRYNKSQLRSLLSIHGTQGPDPGASGDFMRGPSEQDGERGTYVVSPVSVVQRHDEHVTVVELPQISSQSTVPPIDAFTPSSNRNQLKSPAESEVTSTADGGSQPQTKRSGKSIPSNDVSLQKGEDSESDRTRDMPPLDSAPSATLFDRGRNRVTSLSKLYNMKRNRMAEKSSRKDKDKEKKERESVSSNPPLTKDEITIVGGAFDFSQKTVAQVMTALDNVFMLEAALSLNFEVLLLIFQSGHSRVPVYEKTRDNIIGVLFAKDLILLDPEDCVPIKTVLIFFNRTVLLVTDNTPLNKMLNIFKQGGGHMAIVQKFTERPGEDAVADTLGVVTLEDLIEELIGQDIVDETDVYTDNISKKRVKRVRSIDPEVLKMFDSKHHEELLSEKEVLVVASYLSNNTEEFAKNVINMDILKKMLTEIPIVEYRDDRTSRPLHSSHIMTGFLGTANKISDDGNDESNHSDEDPTDKNTAMTHDDANSIPRLAESDKQPKNIYVYTRGVPTKDAYLIINGRLEISAGSDGFISEAGPWTLLGISALTDDLYAPDFTARVTEFPARLLRIPRKLYRLMLQYSSETRSIGEAAARGKGEISPLTLDPAPSARRRGGESSERAVTSPSLALAAAAAAVAVGNPRHGVKLDLAGTASDAAVVRKTRARPNGQSIEWSEMEPLGKLSDARPENRQGRDRVDIVKPPDSEAKG